jgi:formylglycine-generating enzyme required for sulfatase activity
VAGVPGQWRGAANTLVDVPAGSVTLGKPFDSERYGWDNEYGHHTAEVPAFQASRLLVSNGEFLEFVTAGGYAHDAFWDDEGRRWRDFAKAMHPTFWVQGREGWRLRLMTQVVEMPWNWPVEVNCLEARAFCRWRAQQTGQPVRLPTEDEWHRILATSGWQLSDEQPANANLYLEHWASSCPVDHFKHGPFCDVVGNAWQWTETPTYPFEGFKTHPIDDFTTPTFDERHNLIKGGSWIACGNEAEPESRYAFRRHFFQHAGFRYVVAAAPVRAPASHYETDDLITQYMEFHYGATYYGVPNFPRRWRRSPSRPWAGPRRRAMDLGCAVGARCSSWRATSTTWRASISRPASSTRAWPWRAATRCATRRWRRASWSNTRPPGWPTWAFRTRRRAWPSGRATPATSSRNLAATT